MKELLEKLAALADQLDIIEEPDMADEVDLLMQDIADRAAAEEKLEGICETCGGSGAGIDAPWCEACGGSGKGNFIAEASIDKLALKPPYVRRRGNKWVVLDKHNGKVLSEHKTEEKAKGALKAMHVHKG